MKTGEIGTYGREGVEAILMVHLTGMNAIENHGSCDFRTHEIRKALLHLVYGFAVAVG
jgi:hypothetical protein